MSTDSDITALLQAWGGGDKQALNQLMPQIYSQLHALANRAFSGERSDHTLQPTALVNEAYEKLMAANVSWQDRGHFYALAARMMRRMLVNHAVARKTEKRGGDVINVTLNEALLPAIESDADLLALEAALIELAEIDQQKVDLIELQYFAGLSFKEMVEVTGLSSSTLDRHLRFARAWLKVNIAEQTD